MENASKALIMAGGGLIGGLVISLAVYLFVSFGQTSAEINGENSQKQLTQFNSKFTSYEGKKNLTIYDAITVAGYANENNEYYDNDSNYIIIVNLDGRRIDNQLSNIERIIKEINIRIKTSEQLSLQYFKKYILKVEKQIIENKKYPTTKTTIIHGIKVNFLKLNLIINKVIHIIPKRLNIKVKFISIFKFQT